MKFHFSVSESMYFPTGKPFVRIEAGPRNAPNLHFNLDETEELKDFIKALEEGLAFLERAK